MVELNDFDANLVEPALEFEALPPGRYLAVISESEMKNTRDNSGEYLQLKFEILEGPCKGRMLWARLNLNNTNQKAVDFARAQLSSICRAVGVMKPQDSSMLHGIPLTLAVVTRKREDTGELANEIKGYFRADNPGAQPASPSLATPPWAKR